MDYLTPFLSGTVHMTISTLCHLLECLGWRSLEEGQQFDGSWRVFVTSCGHAILARADSRQQAWSIACSMAMKIAREAL
jgi:hypothetical protein